MLSQLRRKTQKPVDTSVHARQSELVDIMDALNLSQAIIEFEPDGTILTANENFLSTTGYKLSEIAGKHHRIFMHPEDATHDNYRRFWEKLAGGEYVSAECRRRTKAGEEIWLQASYNPILDGRGVPYKVIKIATDITREQLEKASAESQSDAIRRAQGVIEFDLDGTILEANDKYLDTVGYSLNEVTGKHHRILVDAATRQSVEYRELWETLNRGDFVSGQFLRIRKDGSPVWIQATYNPVFDPNGKPRKVIKYATDISEQKQHEQNLNELLEEATKVLTGIARGDLTHRMHGQYKSQLSTLSDSINQTIGQLQVTIGQLIDDTMNLRHGSQSLISINTEAYNAANQTARQSEQTSLNANHVSSTVDSVAKALEEMVTSIKEVSRNSLDAVTVAVKAVELSDDAKANVTQLAESSNDIGAVIKVINSIADQTNLLALNATIEAARAGEAGKGFAVVANEVKELAKGTARATEEVSQKISKIQSDSQSAARIINEISEIIETISSTQKSISTTVEEQRAVSADISRSINETASGTTEIANSVSDTSEVARKSLECAEQSQATARELSGLAERLSALTSRFNLTSTLDHS